MNKTPRYDALRAMREAEYERAEKRAVQRPKKKLPEPDSIQPKKKRGRPAGAKKKK